MEFRARLCLYTSGSFALLRSGLASPPSSSSSSFCLATATVGLCHLVAIPHQHTTVPGTRYLVRVQRVCTHFLSNGMPHITHSNARRLKYTQHTSLTPLVRHHERAQAARLRIDHGHYRVIICERSGVS